MAHQRGRFSHFWSGDEELAKKDDDLGLPGHHRPASQWQGARAPRRSVLSRLLVYAVFCGLVVFFLVRVIASSSFSSTEPTEPSSPEGSSSTGFNSLLNQHRSQPQDRTYNGPVRFPQLAKTLTISVSAGGRSEDNRNVFFATGSLKSASTLLPMACEMAAEGHSDVHFLLMSRNEISTEDLLLANGIDESCKITLHDARPDRVAISSETRMEVAAIMSLRHISTFMHPQAIIVDSSGLEEGYFLRGFRDQVRGTAATLIELPQNPTPRLSWITKLDASALAAWNRVNFDILIQAPLIGSGNLKRLLSSLRRADMSAVTPPHLTIELPYVIERELERTLAEFKWPAQRSRQLHYPSLLSIRHRIPRKQMTEDESSARFLESFWPSEPSTTHVLTLAPHTEVSPQFFHYVKYTLLQTLYSNESLLGDWGESIMGISFQSPTTHLDDVTPLTMPKGSDSKAPEKSSGSFLWQSPSSDAVLFLGDRWVELHGYVSQILGSQSSKKDTPAMLAKRNVSKKHPAWLEHVLQLCRLRGYVTLYPSPETANAILGSHSDLGNTPEEYLGDEELAKDLEKGKEDRATSNFDPTFQVDMLATLPEDGSFVNLGDLPLLSLEGMSSSLDEIKDAAQKYAKQFRREVGQCKEAEDSQEDDYTLLEADRLARDLFCTNKEKA
ncbi:hypothetical protein BGZ63DRAFT_484269 [Mariannaea sp. PMI_226]|nr:hypothetical protein BGZ63DRAFT_484269 [Mariannaea sp. PMI_226]